VKTRLKHNKKRNTGILFEVLVRELTKAVMDKNDKKRDFVFLLIKEHFRKGTALAKELELYRTLINTRGLGFHTAEKLIYEVKKEHGSINKRKLFKEQSTLISVINKSLSKSSFSGFFPNYRNLATVYQIFNQEAPTKDRVLLEESILGNIVKQDEDSEDQIKHVDNLTYEGLVESFNKQYCPALTEHQNALLNKYISSFEDNGVELKVFLNEEIARLKTIISESLSSEEMQRNSEIKLKTQQVLTLIENFRERQVDKSLVEDVLKVQDLIKEIRD